MQPGITVRPITSHDWPAYRRLRLAMLAEIPLAFGETLAHAEAMTDAQWIARVIGYTRPPSLRLGAVVDRTGEWAGTMGGFLSPEDGYAAVLVGVYVAPRYRGRAPGVTDALLDGVEDWAREHGDRLLLHVHEENPRARAAYALRGFAESGVRIPYALDPRQTELEMVKRL
jgi:GNAT superfamily N-acetyltransferase